MSSNPHDTTLINQYSRMYEQISKIGNGVPLFGSSSENQIEGNIFIRSKYNTTTPYQTRESLGLDFSPRKEQRQTKKNHRSRFRQPAVLLSWQPV